MYTPPQVIGTSLLETLSCPKEKSKDTKSEILKQSAKPDQPTVRTTTFERKAKLSLHYLYTSSLLQQNFLMILQGLITKYQWTFEEILYNERGTETNQQEKI